MQGGGAEVGEDFVGGVGVGEPGVAGVGGVGGVGGEVVGVGLVPAVGRGGVSRCGGGRGEGMVTILLCRARLARGGWVSGPWVEMVSPMLFGEGVRE